MLLRCLKLADLTLTKFASVVGALLSGAFSRVSRARPEILVLRPGGMGDLVCLDIAGQNFNLADNAIFVIERRSRPWAEYRRFKFVCYDSVEGVLFFFRNLGRFACVVNSEQRFGLSQAAALALMRKGGSLVCFSTNRGVVRSTGENKGLHIVPYDALVEHETKAFGRLLAKQNEITRGSDQLSRGESAVATPATIQKNLGKSIGPPLVWLSGVGSPAREFDSAAWVQWIRKYLSTDQFVLVSSFKERALAVEIKREFPRCEFVFEDFPRAVQRLVSTRCLLTVDSAPVHLASFFDVPTIAVFTCGRSSKWTPLARESLMVRRRDLGCQPCALFGQVPPCGFNFKCREIGT